MLLNPSARVRRQTAQPPSAIVNTAEDSLPVWYKDASLRKMMFWCGCIFAAQICTGFNATLTANFQSITIWKSGELAGLTCDFSKARPPLDMGITNASQLGLVSMIYFLGTFCGSIPGAFITDQL
jgi:hypothetical protein